MKPKPFPSVFEYLTGLYEAAGRPSARTLARGAGGLAHNAINDVLRGHRRGRLATSQQLAGMLGGDPERVRELWEECEPHPPRNPPATREVLLELRETMGLVRRYILDREASEAEANSASEEAEATASRPDADVVEVLRYVARGSAHVDVLTYPEDAAWRALERLGVDAYP
jgi:hypothetical protein